MTIDTSWLSCFKEEVPEAFTQSPPMRAQAVFSDGQIRIMQGPPKVPQTWDDYIYKRFVSHYQHFLKRTDTIIIAFDNYTYVPAAKSMTQTARRSKVPPIPFSESMPLPCMVPEGVYWTQHVANRVFKVKLIELLILRLPKVLLSRFPNSTIIIDYETPCKYTLHNGDIVTEAYPDMPPMGEADIKFTRWTEHFPKLIVDSIDGDSVPIALMNYERKIAQEADILPAIAIYRYTLKKSTGKPSTKENMAKGYEYVYIPQLYMGLQNCIRQVLGRMHLPSHQGHEIRMLTLLITLTGTDFSRHLPQVSGKTVWEMLNDLWMPVAVSYDPASQQINPDTALSKVICKIYGNKFAKHLDPHVSEYDSLLLKLRKSKLSQRTVSNLASEGQLRTTLKNCNWVLQYWTCETIPDPISEQFGYVSVNNKVLYEDCATAI